MIPRHVERVGEGDAAAAKDTTHPDYSSSKRPGMAEAKEAAKGFEVDVETIVDNAPTARKRRKKAERLGKALGAALSA